MTSPIKRKLRQRFNILRNDDAVSRRLIDNALDGNIEPLVGVVLEHRPDFIQLILDRINRAFSDWNFKSVLNFFGMQGVDSSYVPSTFTCPQILVASIKLQLVRLMESRGGNMLAANEKCREKFIDVIVNSFVGELRSFVVLDEERLSGVVPSGNVEYVFQVGPGFNCLLLEAKKQDLPQGYAQLFIEMFTAYRMNISRGYQQDKFFGILSTGDVWYFVEYRCGVSPPFRSSKAYYLDLDDEERLMRLINTFYAFMLNVWSESVDVWHQSRVSAITLAVASDMDPAPDQGTDETVTNQLNTGISAAIDENKGLVRDASSTKDDVEAAMLLNKLATSNQKIKQLMSQWNAEHSVRALLHF